MTRALRQRHRRLWLALAVLLPFVLLAGLLARRPVPVMRTGLDPLVSRTPGLSPH